MKHLIKLTLKRRLTRWLAALHFFGNPSAKLKIVGVTGTNGKTTTATLLYQIATALGHKAGLIGTIENIIGEERRPALYTTPNPRPLNRLLEEMVKAGCEYVFMEVSSHATNEGRVNGIRFAGAVFTNLTQDHLDYHKSFENYFLAKKKLFRMLPSSAFALANVDDKHAPAMLEAIRAKTYSYGFQEKADFSEKLETNLIGGFNAYNALAAYSAAVLLGFDKVAVQEALKRVSAPRGRFEPFTSDTGVMAIVDYAHTPDALENVLKALWQMRQGRAKIISVFGCGGDRDPSKRAVMGRIGANLSDVAIFTSDNPRSEDPEKIIAEMKTDLSLKESQKIKTILLRQEAIAEAVKIARKGDIILIAGKGHEDYQEIKGIKCHFNDMEEVRKAFGVQLDLSAPLRAQSRSMRSALESAELGSQ
jgi:UDP-N-acetylmuramoyl-L-alanyl-D-glutamate--2,6-diaminopimelate ligase